jgi:hypothetical protein
MDIAIILWTVSSMSVYILQQGSSAAVINRLGFAFDVLGMYFLFRCLIRDWSDIEYIILGFIFVSIPVSILFLIEKSSGHNMFSIFGGVPALTMIRDVASGSRAFLIQLLQMVLGDDDVNLLPYGGSPAKYKIFTITGL